MKAISMRTILLLLSFWGLSMGILLAQQSSKYSAIGGYVTPGASILRIGNVSAATNPEDFSANLGLGLNIGANYRFKFGTLGVGGGLEYGIFRNTLNLNRDRTEGVSNGGYFLSNGSPDATPLDTFTLGSNINSEQGLNLNSIGLSVFADYDLTENNGGGYWFVEGGFKLTVFSGSDRINTGNATYEGDFSSAFEGLVKDGDEITVIVDNAPEFGFASGETEGSSISLDNLGFTPSFYLHPAYTFPIGDNGNRIGIGPVIQFNLGSVFGSTSSQFDNLREGDFTYKRPSQELSSAGFTFAGVRAAFYRDIQAKECFDLDTLDVILKPAKSSLANDPEFKFIQEKLSSDLRIRGIMEPNDLPGADGSIVFNSCKISPNNLSPYFESGTKDAKIESAFPLPGEYTISVGLDEDVYPQDLQLNVKDNRGKDIRNFVAEVIFEGEKKLSVKMNSGESISGLFKYQDLRPYEVNVIHPCHQNKSETIRLINRSVLDLKLNPSGNVKQISIPFESAPSMSLSSIIELEGDLKIGANTGEMNAASFDQGILTMQGGCNMGGDLSGNSTVVMKKRKGYDLVLGNKSSDWQSDELQVPLQNASSSEKVKEIPLKVVHLVYVDVSYLEERGTLLDTVENIVKKLKDLDANEIYTAVGSQIPAEAKNYGEIEGTFLESVATQDPNRVPKPRSVVAGFQQVLKKEKIRSDRRNLYLTFFLSKTIYSQSKEIIIGEFMKYLGTEGAPAGIRIITEKPIPSQQEWVPDNYDSELVKYNDLGSK